MKCRVWNMISVLVDLLLQRCLVIYGDVQLTHSWCSSVVHLQSWGVTRSSPRLLNIDDGGSLHSDVKLPVTWKPLRSFDIYTEMNLWWWKPGWIHLLALRKQNLMYWSSDGHWGSAWSSFWREFKTCTVYGSSFLPVKDKKRKKKRHKSSLHKEFPLLIIINRIKVNNFDPLSHYYEFSCNHFDFTHHNSDSNAHLLLFPHSFEFLS